MAEIPSDPSSIETNLATLKQIITEQVADHNLDGMVHAGTTDSAVRSVDDFSIMSFDRNLQDDTYILRIVSTNKHTNLEEPDDLEISGTILEFDSNLRIQQAAVFTGDFDRAIGKNALAGFVQQLTTQVSKDLQAKD